MKNSLKKKRKERIKNYEKIFKQNGVISINTILLVVALGTTTFAWFTVGNTVTVESFQTEVKSIRTRYTLYVSGW